MLLTCNLSLCHSYAGPFWVLSQVVEFIGYSTSHFCPSHAGISRKSYARISVTHIVPFSAVCSGVFLCISKGLEFVNLCDIFLVLCVFSRFLRGSRRGLLINVNPLPYSGWLSMHISGFRCPQHSFFPFYTAFRLLCFEASRRGEMWFSCTLPFFRLQAGLVMDVQWRICR
jgi:hypothetical protein